MFELNKINLRGQLGSQTMVFVFLFLMIVIGVGIVAGVSIFFGSGYDFRGNDAEILNFKTRECLIKEGVDFGLEKKDLEKEFFERCRISKESMLNNSLILKVCVDKDIENCVVENGEIQIGGNFNACSFEGVKENDAFPICYRASLKVEGIEYSVISGSNQKIKLRRVGI